MRGVGLAFAALVAACSTEPPPCSPERLGLACPIAGTGKLGFNQDGLPPSMTDLYLVSRVRRGPDGLIYLMDFNNQRLRRIGADGLVETIAGTGFHGFALLGRDGRESGLENPIDFDFLPDGRLVFISYHDPRVIFLDEDNVLRSLAGTGEIGLVGDEGDGGPALDAMFIDLTGLALGPGGSPIYVSDSKAHRVRKIEGGLVTTIAGDGVPRYGGDGGPGREASLSFPTALATDAAGNLYIADNRNHRVRRVGRDGIIETVAGTGEKGFSGDGGPATAARLDGPDGLAIAPDGTMYIADRQSFRIRRVRPDGVIETIAGSGRQGPGGDGGPALSADFGYIARITLDDDGSLLIADQSNSKARRVILPD